jgi:hypothetical protein
LIGETKTRYPPVRAIHPSVLDADDVLAASDAVSVVGWMDVLWGGMTRREAGTLPPPVSEVDAADGGVVDVFAA